MDFNEIKELIKMIDDSNLTTMELEKDGFRICLKKEEKVFPREMIQGTAFGQISGGMSGTGYVQGTAGVQEEVSTQETAKPYGDHPTINSPIVGTFYAAPSPDENPFVHPGSTVKQGDTLCIIEAMKLMNDIEAEKDLQILEVLVKDGDMVEYGQPLFVVKQS